MSARLVLVIALCACGGSQLAGNPNGPPDAGCVGSTCVTPPTGVCGDMQNDPQNCGACRNVCASTQACNAGSCGAASTLAPIASVSSTMDSLAIDGASVYFADRNVPGGIYSAPLAGGGATLLVTESGPNKLVRTGSTLVYASDGSSQTLVRSLPTAGGSPVTLATLGSSTAVEWLAADSSAAFWTQIYPTAVADVPLAGGSVVTLNGNASAFPGDVAVDATNVYWEAGGDIFSAPRAGGPATTLVSGMFAGRLIVYGGYLYFSTSRGFQDPGTGLYRVPVQGGTPTTIATRLYLVTTMVTDGTTIYFADGANDFSILRRAPAAGGAPYVSLTNFIPTPLWSALDGSWVYFNDRRSVYRVAR